MEQELSLTDLNNLELYIEELQDKVGLNASTADEIFDKINQYKREHNLEDEDEF